MIATRGQRERLYLAALGNLTASIGLARKEFLALRALVHQAEMDLMIAESEISRHQDPSHIKVVSATAG